MSCKTLARGTIGQSNTVVSSKHTRKSELLCTNLPDKYPYDQSGIESRMHIPAGASW